MRSAGSSAGPVRRGGRWRWLLGVALLLAAHVPLSLGVLFGGTEVACVEAGGATDAELRCSFVVAAPPATVWEAFTTVGEPRAFYFDSVLEADLRPGGRWRFVTDDRQRLLAGGTIVALEPPRRFEQTFAAADLDDPPSRITVEIEPVADGSRVLLVHGGFASQRATRRTLRPSGCSAAARPVGPYSAARRACPAPRSDRRCARYAAISSLCATSP